MSKAQRIKGLLAIYECTGAIDRLVAGEIRRLGYQPVWIAKKDWNGTVLQKIKPVKS